MYVYCIIFCNICTCDLPDMYMHVLSPQENMHMCMYGVRGVT